MGAGPRRTHQSPDDRFGPGIKNRRRKRVRRLLRIMRAPGAAVSEPPRRPVAARVPRINHVSRIFARAYACGSSTGYTVAVEFFIRFHHNDVVSFECHRNMFGLTTWNVLGRFPRDTISHLTIFDPTSGIGGFRVSTEFIHKNDIIICHISVDTMSPTTTFKRYQSIFVRVLSCPLESHRVHRK